MNGVNLHNPIDPHVSLKEEREKQLFFGFAKGDMGQITRIYLDDLQKGIGNAYAAGAYLLSRTTHVVLGGTVDLIQFMVGGVKASFGLSIWLITALGRKILFKNALVVGSKEFNEICHRLQSSATILQSHLNALFEGSHGLMSNLTQAESAFNHLLQYGEEGDKRTSNANKTVPFQAAETILNDYQYLKRVYTFVKKGLEEVESLSDEMDYLFGSYKAEREVVYQLKKSYAQLNQTLYQTLKDKKEYFLSLFEKHIMTYTHEKSSVVSELHDYLKLLNQYGLQLQPCDNQQLESSFLLAERETASQPLISTPLQTSKEESFFNFSHLSHAFTSFFSRLYMDTTIDPSKPLPLVNLGVDNEDFLYNDDMGSQQELGLSCYLNSAIQVLLSFPKIEQKLEQGIARLQESELVIRDKIKKYWINHFELARKFESEENPLSLEQVIVEANKIEASLRKRMADLNQQKVDLEEELTCLASRLDQPVPSSSPYEVASDDLSTLIENNEVLAIYKNVQPEETVPLLSKSKDGLVLQKKEIEDKFLRIQKEKEKLNKELSEFRPFLKDLKDLAQLPYLLKLGASLLALTPSCLDKNPSLTILDIKDILHEIRDAIFDGKLSAELDRKLIQHDATAVINLILEEFIKDPLRIRKLAMPADKNLIFLDPEELNYTLMPSFPKQKERVPENQEYAFVEILKEEFKTKTEKNRRKFDLSEGYCIHQTSNGGSIIGKQNKREKGIHESQAYRLLSQITQLSQDILVVSIKRFDFIDVEDGSAVFSGSGKTKKIPVVYSNDVELPKDGLIDLKSYLSLEYRQTLKSKEATQFELTGIVVHSGTQDQGHYISYVKRKDHFYRCNDSIVHEISKEEFYNIKQGYVFFFSRKHANSG